MYWFLFMEHEALIFGHIKFSKADIYGIQNNILGLLQIGVFFLLITCGPLAEKRDLMTNSENLKIRYILKILSV